MELGLIFAKGPYLVLCGRPRLSLAMKSAFIFVIQVGFNPFLAVVLTLMQ